MLSQLATQETQINHIWTKKLFYADPLGELQPDGNQYTGHATKTVSINQMFQQIINPG